MPKWLIGEFIRHRKFNDTKQHWDDEINESYCSISLQDCISLAKNSNFKVIECAQQFNGLCLNYYHFDKNNFEIYNSVGDELNEIDFPQHYHIILQKQNTQIPSHFVEPKLKDVII